MLPLLLNPKAEGGGHMGGWGTSTSNKGGGGDFQPALTRSSSVSFQVQVQFRTHSEECTAMCVKMWQEFGKCIVTLICCIHSCHQQIRLLFSVLTLRGMVSHKTKTIRGVRCSSVSEWTSEVTIYRCR